MRSPFVKSRDTQLRPRGRSDDVTPQMEHVVVLSPSLSGPLMPHYTGPVYVHISVVT